MAKAQAKRVTKLKATSWAAFQGTFASILGLGVAILHSIDSTARVAESTDSVLRGMAFGLATGVVSIIVVPLVYFAIGWVIGLVQGWVFNVVLGAAGGLSFELEDE
jgi:tetrahydromethanopterin S-methyltransferase subunit C